MDTSSEDQVVNPVPSLQLGSTGGFSLNLSGVGTKPQEESSRREGLNVEEEDEFNCEDMNDTPKVMPSHAAIPKLSLKLPTISSDSESVSKPTTDKSVIANTKIESVTVDLLIPNLCTLILDFNTEDIKTRIEEELDNSIKREDLELFVLQPLNSLKDIKDSDRIVCRAKNSNSKF